MQIEATARASPPDALALSCRGWFDVPISEEGALRQSQRTVAALEAATAPNESHMGLCSQRQKSVGKQPVDRAFFN